MNAIKEQRPRFSKALTARDFENPNSFKFSLHVKISNLAPLTKLVKFADLNKFLNVPNLTKQL